MCGVVGAQHGWQDIHETLHAVGCHLTMNHGLQGPLEAFHYRAFDVIFSLVNKCMSLYFSSRWKGTARVMVSLLVCMTSSGWSSISSRMAYMAAAISVPHWLIRGHGQAYLENMSVQQKRYLVVAHQAVQRVTLISGQGFPDGRPSRVPAQACPQLGDSSQATCLARSVITVTQVRHGGGLVFFFFLATAGMMMLIMSLRAGVL